MLPSAGTGPPDKPSMPESAYHILLVADQATAARAKGLETGGLAVSVAPRLAAARQD